MTEKLSTSKKNKIVRIDTRGVSYRELNATLRQTAKDNDRIELYNVCGQRYVGTNLNRKIEINVIGTPGNDLGAFMDGPKINIYGNAQDGCGNTMNSGEIVIHGHAGDIIGLSARGGKIFVRDDVGYRAGIHMKEYGDKKPVLVIGGTAQSFLGEYMAGGVLVLLGLTLKEGEPHKASFIGTGMHGGVIFLKGSVENHQLGKEVVIAELNEADHRILKKHVNEYSAHFGFNADDILKHKFIKFCPTVLRPYGRLYAY